ncbi:MAG: secondary thiamine-phosphate synthase enzyme YjbQ [Bacteroidota bacterium]
MQDIIQIKTDKTNGLFDITREVEAVARKSNVEQGIVSVYVQGATAAIMIQENWDQSVQNDVVSLLKKLIPSGIWEHDAQDNNGDAHLKAGLVGPSETIPLVNGSLGLSTWQNIFVCEFDGPRRSRNVIVTIHEA